LPIVRSEGRRIFVGTRGLACPGPITEMAKAYGNAARWK
jgi:TusA-related sulfurtransferase